MSTISNYERAMQSADVTYRNVLDALHRAEVPAHITQTGGMNLAIVFRHPDGVRQFMLTDKHDALSWQPHPSDGWMLGLYADEDDVYECVRDPRYWDHDVKSPSTAVELVMLAIRESA